MRCVLVRLGIVVFVLMGCGADDSESGSGVSGGRGGSGGTGKGGSSGGEGGEGGDTSTAGGEATGGTKATGGTNGTSGAGGTPGESCAGDTLTADSEARPADIIIAIDQSSSMDAETQFVQMQINAFAKQLTDQDVDARVILIAENPDGPVGENVICVPEPLAGPMCGDNPDMSFMNVNHHVDSHDAFAWVLDCYAGTDAHTSCYDSESKPATCAGFAYQGNLRDEAVKHVVVITDDDPCMTSAMFDTEFQALDPARHGDYMFHAIVPFTACPERAGPADDYLALVTQRMGVSGDLCMQDFQPVWDKLVENVVKTALLSCIWDIPPVPMGETLDPDQVNVSYTLDGMTRDLGRVASEADCTKAKDAWYYDDPGDPTQILVCPDVCDEIQAAAGGSQQIDIQVGCETVMAPLL
jgi:hypothetical protein